MTSDLKAETKERLALIIHSELFHKIVQEKDNKIYIRLLYTKILGVLISKFKPMQCNGYFSKHNISNEVAPTFEKGKVWLRGDCPCICS